MHSDLCDVKIYIVADSNRVTFLFFNTVAKIKEDENEAFVSFVISKSFADDTVTCDWYSELGST